MQLAPAALYNYATLIANSHILKDNPHANLLAGPTGKIATLHGCNRFPPTEISTDLVTHWQVLSSELSRENENPGPDDRPRP